MATTPNNNPLTDDERQRIRELHAAGLSRNDIARELERSGSTISRAARDMGLSFERGPEVEAATKAMVADAKAKRAQLMNDLLDDAERLRVQLFAPTVIHSFGGKEHTYNSKHVEEPLFRDKRDIVQSVSTAITASLRLDQHDKTDNGAEQARGMVNALFGALGIAADALPDDDPTADDDDNSGV